VLFMNPGLFIKILISVSFFISSVSCTFLGEDVAELLTREKIYDRKDSINQLRYGIHLNMGICPDHYYSGLYASEVHVPVAARKSFYTKKSVDNCVVLLSAIPCSINTQTDILFFTNTYLSVLRNCGLKEVKDFGNIF